MPEALVHAPSEKMLQPRSRIVDNSRDLNRHGRKSRHPAHNKNVWKLRNLPESGYVISILPPATSNQHAAHSRSFTEGPSIASAGDAAEPLTGRAPEN
ncbi:hypothetical protein MKX08_007190 [Trichoderma sp. CBMAI-0020]|nr:hypothetical protein MKX08_007190 [Trichoderma sp. CBMAI-0020]WOD46617.1 hypothetical protein [Trichoderma atroviride]